MSTNENNDNAKNEDVPMDNKNDNNESNVIDLESLTEKLKEEAKKWLHMSKSYKQNRYYRDEKEGYLISKIWLRKWKEYVNYTDIKDADSYRYKAGKEYKIDPNLHPGPITNNLILSDRSCYYNDGNDEDIENQVVRHDIDQNNELRIITEEMYKFLLERYEGGPTIIKPMIEEETKYNRRKVFEVYYSKFSLLPVPTKDQVKKYLQDEHTSNVNFADVKPIYIRKHKTLTQLKEKILNSVITEVFANCDDIIKLQKENKITVDNFRLFRFSGEFKRENLLEFIKNSSEKINKDEQISNEGLLYLEYLKNIVVNEIDAEDTDTIVVEFNFSDNSNVEEFEKNWLIDVPKIEFKKTKCDWCSVVKHHRICCPCKDVWYCSETCKVRDSNYHENNCKKRFEVQDNSNLTYTPNSKKGLVGLQNLGNTCFMNTSLQCLANCIELSEYFLQNFYKKDINSDNPIGTQGALATSYAKLLKELYYGESSSVAPRQFKQAIATFQSMFTGYAQHDTQEFLNFLLDGLHEDLNLVKKKPFVPKYEESDKNDDILAEHAWKSHLRRNQSALVDLFYGQFKQTTTCNCSNVAKTFDPYLSLSLPLVNRVQPYEVVCFFIFYDLSLTPIQITLKFNTKTNIMALRNKVSKMMNINPMSFYVCKMDPNGLIDIILNTKSPLFKNAATSHSNEKPYFLFQINPQVFMKSNFYIEKEYNTDYPNMMKYLSENSSKFFEIMETIDEKDETSDTLETENYYSTSNYFNRTKEKAVIKYNTDLNHGFDNTFLTVQTFMFYSTTVTTDFPTRGRLVFPRLMPINKKSTAKELFKMYFDYFYPLIKSKLIDEMEGKPQPMSENNRSSMASTYAEYKVLKEDMKRELIENKDALFDYYFSDYDSSSSSDKNCYFDIKNIPFRIHFNSFIHKYIQGDKNIFNGESIKNNNSEHSHSSSNIDGYVLLPIDNTLIEDLTAKIPKNSNETDIDNSFLYMSESNKHYSNLNNRDFVLLINWNPAYFNYVKKLNDKQDFDFQHTKKLKDSVDLEECFKQFCKEEILEEENKWYCPSCKEHVRAKVHYEIYSTPPILIVHLKRFKANHKIDTFIDYPVNDLDMGKYIIGPKKHKNNKYDLFAVAHHYGGMGGGHYVASAKNPFNNKWYNFNDSSVSSDREDSVVASSGYVLFYRHQNIKELVNFEEIYNKKFIDYEEDILKLEGKSTNK